MLIDATKITKKVKDTDGQYLTILDEINLQVEKAAFISIMGPSGSGKTTLLQILGLMDSATSGKYLFNNQLVSTLTLKQKARIRANNIGFVFQQPLLNTDLTLKENLLLSTKITNKNISPEKINETLNYVGLTDKRNNYIGTLSTGEAQRGALARAIINDPDIIIADEPTANLDKENKIRILELLKDFNVNRNISIILASHDELVMNYSSKLLTLKEGKLSL